MQTHTFNVSAILSADSIKYTNVFLLFSFLSSFFKLCVCVREREREREIDIEREHTMGGGRKRFYRVLSFSTTGFYWEYFLWRVGGILWSSAWGVCYFLPKSSTSFLHPESGMRFSRPFTATSVPKLISFFLFPLTKKKATSVFRVLANRSASFSFLHPVRRFVRTTICSYTLFFIHPVTECKHLLAFILTWICYFGREELTYIPYSFSNGQSLAAC